MVMNEIISLDNFLIAFLIVDVCSVLFCFIDFVSCSKVFD